MMRLALSLLLIAPTALAAESPSQARPDNRLGVRLDTAATWGIGGQMHLGGLAHLQLQNHAWSSRRAYGTVDVGAEVAYHNEATFLAPWIDTTRVSGATHRVQGLLTFGTTFHMAKEQRFSLGLHVFGGWNHWRSDYAIDAPEFDIVDSAILTDDRFTAGGQLTLAYRISDVVGIDLVLKAPFPLGPDPVIGVGSLGIGPTFYVR